MTVRSIATAASLLATFGLASTAHAAENDWEMILGLGASHESSIYKGVDGETNPQPIAHIEYGDFWVRGEQAGYTLLEGNNWSLSPVISLGVGSGFEQDNVKDNDLFKGLDERKAGIGYGLTLGYDMQWAELTASVLNDTKSDISAGFELGREFQITDRFSIETAASATWRSSGYNDYYYGISSKEAGNNPLLSTYKADAGVDMGLEVMATYQLSSRWLLVGGAEYTRFSSSVTDSQLVDKSNQTSVMAGVAYMF